MRNLLIKFTHWLLETTISDKEYKELNRLLIRGGRRCAYDLRHAADSLWFLTRRLQENGFLLDEWRLNEHEFYSNRSNYWLGVFNVGNNGKCYRDELHLEISSLEYKLSGYKKLIKDLQEKYPDLKIRDTVDDDSIPF